MKHISLLSKAILSLFIFLTFSVNAQSNKMLQLKSGNFTLENNIKSFVENPIIESSELINNNYYRIIQFSEIPSVSQKNELKEKGVDLLSYLPENAFYASINKNADLQVLEFVNAISVVKVRSQLKLSKVLTSKKYPEWAMLSNKMIEINAIYYNNIPEELILNRLKENGAKIVISNQSNVVSFIIKLTDLEMIYKQPEFYYFEEKDMPGEPEGIEDRTDHRSNTIATEYSGGLKFDGTGITVMLQDDGDLEEHIDYQGRFFNDASVFGLTAGHHGEHTGGIIGGAGNLNPDGRGNAYGADILVYNSSNNNYNDVPGLIISDDLTITSKSFSNGTNAGYTTLARQLDQQIRDSPELSHVFSAGNAGSGWSTITGGHKQGKNVIAVGNVTYTDVIAGSSSRGPALDGRIKPDICAVGTNVFSTLDPYSYRTISGTSMSCPAVAGNMAQLYHAYKTMNAGVNPNSALIKAAVLNTGDDLGNSGPDFTYGWGRINARRAHDLLNTNSYIFDSIAQSGSKTHNINVPVGTTQLRVMVYWSDVEGAASAAPALVNNINMQVIDPGSTSYNPWVLNPTNQSAVAVRAIDNLNNMEQVTIDNPTAGSYTVNIDGATIPQGPQEYFVVYEFIQDEVVLTYPIGGEGLNPGNTETIRWDSYGVNGSFQLEYSTDNGGTWNNIITSVSALRRYFDWTVPSTVSGEVLVRVTRGALSSTSHEVFSIIPTPINLNVDWVCVDSLKLSWDAVTGATSYEVSQLGAKYMDSIGVTTTNSIVLHGTSSAVRDWFSVRSLGPNNARGERAIAVEKVLGTFSCPIAIDAGLADLSPFNNRMILSCSSSILNVSVNIKNEGFNSLSNIPVHYISNGQVAVNETYLGTIAPGANFTYTFTSTISPNAGNNTLLVWTDMGGDLNNTNDSVSSQYTYTSTLAKIIPWSDDFEGLTACGTTNNCELEICTLNNDFINEINGNADDIDWRTDAGGTPSPNSGPSTDFNPGITGGKYLYLEASGGCTGQQANLISPCISLINVLDPELTFAYHMSGSDMGSLHVDIFVNNAWVDDIIPTIDGDQGTDWLTTTISLLPYSGNVVNFRFRGITGNGFNSDIAIDDIQFTGTATVGVDELASNLNFNIYPNPSNGLYNFTYTGEELLNVELYDVNGKVIYSEKINGTSSKENGVIDIKDYADGIYMLVLSKDGERITKRLIKK